MFVAQIQSYHKYSSSWRSDFRTKCYYMGQTKLTIVYINFSNLSFKCMYCTLLYNGKGKLTPAVSHSEGTKMKRAAEDVADGEGRKCIHLDGAPESEGGEFVRRKRRKFALLLSYSGKGYLGMQR